MFAIDYSSGVPIFEQIYRTVITLGAAGAFGETGQLPSVRAVAKELGINPNTVQKAYSMLERDGVVNSLPGKGSFLAQPQAAAEKRRSQALAALRSALREALDAGLTPEEIRSTLDKTARDAAPGPDKEVKS